MPQHTDTDAHVLVAPPGPAGCEAEFITGVYGLGTLAIGVGVAYLHGRLRAWALSHGGDPSAVDDEVQALQADLHTLAPILTAALEEVRSGTDARDAVVAAIGNLAAAGFVDRTDEGALANRVARALDGNGVSVEDLVRQAFGDGPIDLGLTGAQESARSLAAGFVTLAKFNGLLPPGYIDVIDRRGEPVLPAATEEE